MTDTTRQSFLDRRRDAALEQIREQQVEFERVSRIVIPSDRHGSRRRVTDVVKLGGDHLVEVADRDDVMWTFVVGGKASNNYHYTQEDAILHLIATRYDSNPNSSQSAAFYAGRVLGISNEGE